MIDPKEKSTEVPPSATSTEVAHGVALDSRLAIFHRELKWLAVSDLHFGYEVSRRMAGGLWPLWGMHSIQERLRKLVEDWNPEQLILVGDIVDSGAVPGEAIDWLEDISEICSELILIEGNHDRGEVKRRFDFVPWFRSGGYFFHHGHRNHFQEERNADDRIEVTGHRHPSIRFHDGTGTALRLPALTQESFSNEACETWCLPAFSPWAGGNPIRPKDEKNQFRQWACGGNRVFEVN